MLVLSHRWHMRPETCVECDAHRISASTRIGTLVTRTARQISKQAYHTSFQRPVEKGRARGREVFRTWPSRCRRADMLPRTMASGVSHQPRSWFARRQPYSQPAVILLWCTTVRARCSHAVRPRRFGRMLPERYTHAVPIRVRLRSHRHLWISSVWALLRHPPDC